jgi:hypothetical protein
LTKIEGIFGVGTFRWSWKEKEKTFRAGRFSIFNSKKAVAEFLKLFMQRAIYQKERRFPGSPLPPNGNHPGMSATKAALDSPQDLNLTQL